MKRIILLLFACLALTATRAQDSVKVFRFGYLSYDSALVSMPDYALAQQKLNELRAQFEAELKRVELDFNTKYEEFLEGQRDYPQTILRKRQTELKELLERNVAFKAEIRQEMAKAEAEAMEPLKEKLNEVLTRLGLEQGYAFILNTDAGAAPFVHPAFGVDISQEVANAFK